MNSDQETSGGFLPPANTGFTNELRRQPSSSTTTLTGNNPHHLHLPRFTKFNIPPIDTVVTQDSHLAAAHGGETIFTIPSTSFRDAVAASPAVDTRNVISPTVSDITTSPDQEHANTTSTPPKGREPPRRNPLLRTFSDTISTVRKPNTPSPNSRTTAPGSSNRSDRPQFKRLKTDIEQRCWEVRGESGITEQDVEDGNPSEAIVEQGEEEEEEEDEVRGEFVGFRRLDAGSLSIKLSCSCGNCFEFLRNRIGCFYKLTI